MEIKIKLIYCNRCGEIPIKYIVIEGIYLCKKCALGQYNKELKVLNGKYLGVL